MKERKLIYLLVIAPDTATIYPERLPRWARRRAVPYSRLDQLLASAQQRKNFNIVDLREELLLQKSNFEFPLYHKTDTHWSELGGYVAYRKIMTELGRVAIENGKSDNFAKPIPLTEFTLGWGALTGGDLSRMIGLQDLVREHVVELNPKKPVPYIQLGSDPIDFVTTYKSRNGPRALIIRDSFFSTLWPFTSYHFPYVHYWWKKFDFKQVDLDRPEIVIEEIVERHLNEKYYKIE